MTDTDSRYLDILLRPIRACVGYQPKFGRGGRGEGVSLEQFREIYRADAFYTWFGLDHPLMYAAHKAAGGMTSIYRQIGIGCEALFRTVLQDSFGLSEQDSSWSYQIPRTVDDDDTRARTLHLDARVQIDRIADLSKRERFHDWLRRCAVGVGIDPGISSNLHGAVFEVRQGYKSKDSKRQNADLANAANAFALAYLPCAAILSAQIDNDILSRYRQHRWVVMIGVVGENDTTTSTYDFMRDVVGYDLAAFFGRHSDTLRQETETVLRSLLTPEHR